MKGAKEEHKVEVQVRYAVRVIVDGLLEEVQIRLPPVVYVNPNNDDAHCSSSIFAFENYNSTLSLSLSLTFCFVCSVFRA